MTVTETKDQCSSNKACNDISELLLSAGIVSRDDLEYGERIKDKLAIRRPLTSILLELGTISEDQLRDTIRANRSSIRLGTLLVLLDIISEQDLQTAIALQKETPSLKLGEILIQNHFVREDQVLDILSVQLNIPYLDSDSFLVDKRLTSRVKPAWLEKHLCFPTRGSDGSLQLAFANPLQDFPLEEAEGYFGQKIIPCIARKSTIEAAISSLTKAKREAGFIDVTENSIVKGVNDLLVEAIVAGASDIHLEPMKDRLRVRFREDGVLLQHKDFPLKTIRPMTSRIKIMAGADIAERRRHQDGRMFFEHGGAKIDFRVSFYATIHGEKIVMRLLNNRSHLLDINDIGMSPGMARSFVEDVLDVPSGVVLITGPTGSGKTTTLYGAINYLNNINTSIITAEDPVEYVIPGINQCSINPKIDITFEETLRHIVRQDPDVIVIGEIRDRFSADTAIQAALTGHKILTTFHTEDTIGGLLRLLHMDIEAFLISSTVVSVLAQRLLRQVCPHCAEEHNLSPDEIRRLGYNPKDTGRVTFTRGAGCKECRFLGYKGRIGVFELLILNEDVKDALINRKTSYEIRRISIESTGMVSLLEDGIVKGTQGLTSFDEIIRSLPRLGSPRPLDELYRLQGVK